MKKVTRKKLQKKAIKKVSPKRPLKKGSRKVKPVEPAVKQIKMKKPREEKQAALRRMLIQRREEIVREAKAEIAKYIKGDKKQLVDTALDNGDWSIVNLSEDIVLRQLTSHRTILLKIDEALRKLDEGTYGKCEDCGDDISEERLKVLPFATLCRDCQEKKEQLEELEKAEEIG